METLSRNSLARKKLPELKTMIRQLGADSPDGESRESLINRILMFTPAPQFDAPKPKEIAEPTTEEAMKDALKQHIKRGLEVKVVKGCWHMTYQTRTDSGTMTMPTTSMVRCADILMR